MKNKGKVKVYNRIKKPFLKRTSTKIFCVGLAIALASGGIATGIHIKKENDFYDSLMENSDSSYSESASDYIVPETAENLWNIEYGEDKPTDRYMNKTVMLSNSDYNDFNDYINKYKKAYTYESLYGIDEALKVYEKNNVVKHANDITSGTGVIDPEVLYETVLENSNNYLKSKDRDNPALDKLNSRTMKKVCDIVSNVLNYEIKHNSSIDKEKVFCNLATLKMFKESGFANAYIDEHNNFVIDEDQIKDYSSLTGEEGTSYEETFKQVITHETEHLLQSACSCMEKKGEYEIGNTNSYEDLDVNPLSYPWFIESAAETASSELYNMEPATYQSFINYKDSLALVVAINPNKSGDSIQNASFSKDEDALYKAFDASTLEEKKEVIKLMYSIEVLQETPEDFQAKYKEKYGIDLSADKVELEKMSQIQRVDIVKKLSLYFYKNLSKAMNNEKMSINDMFYVINLFESDIYNHLLYNEEDRVKTSKEFMDFYIPLQANLFNKIAKELGCQIDEIYDGLENYSMYKLVDGKTVPNFDASKFGNEDSQFFEYFQKNYYRTGAPSIYKVDKIYEENNYVEKYTKY